MPRKVAEAVGDKYHGLPRTRSAQSFEQLILAERIHRRGRLVYNYESHLVGHEAHEGPRSISKSEKPFAVKFV